MADSIWNMLGFYGFEGERKMGMLEHNTSRFAGRGSSFGKVSMLTSVVAGLALVIGCAGSQVRGPYEVEIPEEWKQDLSVGRLRFVGSAFYGVPWPLGLYPVVRVNLPVENLSSETLYFGVNYRTESKKRGYGNSGMGVRYTLGPGEKRVIDAIAPIASATRPIRFILRISQPNHSLDAAGSADAKVVIRIDPFKRGEVFEGDITLTKADNEDFEIEEVQLAHSEDEGNQILFKVRNKTDEDLLIGVWLAVNDPINIETKGVLARPRGFYAESVETIPAKEAAVIRMPYNIGPVGSNPALAFTLFKPHKDIASFGERDMRERDIRLVCYGSFNLRAAAERGECVIPVHAPAEERAKLTAERQSEHFLFRYRPGSYAEGNIEEIIREREEVYDKLSSVLQMELPEVVTIDLYPDMEAKGLGSGTTWTPCNTRTKTHICEVYGQTYQCDAYHELAHIFSYHFPDYGSNEGGIVEAFAAYFEPHNMPVGETKESLKVKLREGKLSSMGEILLSDSSSEELALVIDFLIDKDVKKFKRFYVRVTLMKKKKDLEKAVLEIYQTDLKRLEQQWHQYLNEGNDI